VTVSHNPVIRVNHTGVSVSDLEQSLAFYVGVLGLEQVFQSHVSARRDIDACVGLSDVDADIVFLDAGDTRVELWRYANPPGRPLDATHPAADIGVSHLAFEVDDVDSMYHRAIAAGYVGFAKPIDLGIHKSCYIQGPDGEIVELLEDQGSSREDLRRIEEARRRAAHGHAPEGGSSNG
jgi:catechol 2,3-dioxygenase-like lactoylglutathione lyase family enzyme